MSEESLRLIDKRAALRRQMEHSLRVAHTLMRTIQRLLTADSKRRAEVDAEDIGACMGTTQGTSPDLQGDYTILNRWYQHTLVRQPNPS